MIIGIPKGYGPFQVKELTVLPYTVDINDNGLCLLATVGGAVISIVSSAQVIKQFSLLVVNASSASLLLGGASFLIGAEAAAPSVTLLPGEAVVVSFLVGNTADTWTGYRASVIA